MRVLFVHQNFPAQYRHLAAAIARTPGFEVAAIGDAANTARLPPVPGVKLLAYSARGAPTPGTHHYVRPLEGHVRRGQEAFRACVELSKRGFKPDVVYAHPGWGEALYLRDVFPKAKITLYCEFFYRAHGSDVDFDPEYGLTPDDVLRVRTKNATMLLSIDAADDGIAPTQWQKDCYPAWFQQRISVLHDGIDTDLVTPDASARLELPDGRGTLTAHDEVVTYVARNLEPYRGFHTFMRALPFIQEKRPKAHAVIVGGSDVSYGKQLPKGTTYKQKLLDEVGGRLDLSRVHFIDWLPHDKLVDVYRVSGAHVYLTYPFVLSWSMLEAMSAGAALVASDTAPVREVITHGKTGLMADFFQPEAVAEQVDAALRKTPAIVRMREQARETVRKRFDLKRVCLPRHLALLSAKREQGQKRRA